MKPRLLVVELWALGDLVIATPFLKAATERFEVTLLAKPHAAELAARFWPGVKLVPFIAPWTAFRHKYRLLRWPWRELFRLGKLRGERFEFGVSAREDPRDHVLLRWLCVGKRLGFPRRGSQLLLSDPLIRPGQRAHRYEYWRAVGRTLDLELPARDRIPIAPREPYPEVLIHTGAGQKVRVWPLDRYRNLVARLRRQNYRVRVACDRDQADWWRSAGEKEPLVPQSLGELITLMETAAVFVGNDSGPGHLAALSGVPTFTVFGPQLPESFSPLHPAAEWLEGKPCPYKPCWDSCRFPIPHCLWDLEEETVGSRVDQFVAKHIQKH